MFLLSLLSCLPPLTAQSQDYDFINEWWFVKDTPDIGDEYRGECIRFMDNGEVWLSSDDGLEVKEYCIDQEYIFQVEDVSFFFSTEDGNLWDIYAQYSIFNFEGTLEGTCDREQEKEPLSIGEAQYSLACGSGRELSIHGLADTSAHTQ